MTPEEIAEIRERQKKTGEINWYPIFLDESVAKTPCWEVWAGDGLTVAYFADGFENAEDNAKFIGHAQRDVLFLLDALDAMEKERDEAIKRKEYWESSSVDWKAHKLRWQERAEAAEAKYNVAHCHAHDLEQALMRHDVSEGLSHINERQIETIHKLVKSKESLKARVKELDKEIGTYQRAMSIDHWALQLRIDKAVEMIKENYRPGEVVHLDIDIIAKLKGETDG